MAEGFENNFGFLSIGEYHGPLACRVNELSFEDRSVDLACDFETIFWLILVLFHISPSLSEQPEYRGVSINADAPGV